MKKLMSSMLAIAAMASMISCSTEDILDEKTSGTDNNGLVPIKMTAEIGGLTTKAAIGQEGDGKLTNPLDVFFLRSDGANADWTALKAPLNATIDKQGNIEFKPTQYYPQDATINTFLIGYYPEATTTNNKLAWVIDGKKDIIISDVKQGNKQTALDALAAPGADANADALAFSFDHKLTQFKFKVKIPTAETPSGEKLESITVNNLKTNVEYDFTTNKLLFTTGDVTSLQTEDPVKTTAISSTTPVDGGTLLVEASGEKDFDVEVKTTIQNGDGTTTTKTYAGTVKIGAVENTAYDVTLTIAQKEVKGTASIGIWETDTAGDTTIY